MLKSSSLSFSLYSQSLNNIQRISNSLNDIAKCKLNINNQYSIELSLIFLTCLSTKFTEEVINDCTKRDFYVYIDKKYVTDDVINKLTKLFCLEEIKVENLNEILFFMKFGKEIQCDLFKFFFESYSYELIDDNEESLQNALILLIEKFHTNSNYERELNFIAKNFTKIVENEDILSILASYDMNIDIYDCILSSNDLRIKNEDFLLNFILKLAKKSPEFLYLIQHVNLEFCSIPCVDRLLSFAKEHLCYNHSLECLFYCFGRRLLQEKIPAEKIEQNQRYENDNDNYHNNNNNEKEKKDGNEKEYGKEMRVSDIFWRNENDDSNSNQDNNAIMEYSYNEDSQTDMFDIYG